MRFCELFQSRSSRSFFVETSITPMVNSSDLEFAATVDNFHFSVPFSKVFLSGSVCVQVSTFPSFALWPSFDKFMGNDVK